MDQKGFISDADTALANLIWNCIEKESVEKNIISSQEQISFSFPKADGAIGNRKLSIFLYNITEETVAKNMPPTEDKSKKMLTGMSFDLHYIVIPFTGNDQDDHILLEKIIYMFSVTPLIGENDVRLKVKIDSLSLDNLSKLWVALGAPLRLSVGLTVSYAEPQPDSQVQVTNSTVTPQAPEFDAKHVTQLYQAVFKIFTEQSNGWMNRNMVVKQWVLQDFKKNSGMTAEEVLSMLNNLGGKLEQNQSTAQFIKPLNQLAGYYEYQLDQLKGMQKLSHNQRENLETIDRWIKEVKTLVEALAART